MAYFKIPVLDFLEVFRKAKKSQNNVSIVRILGP
jgi:hypothetical protein